VWGLSLIHGYGQTLMAADEKGHVSPVAWLVGLVFSAMGWLGWMAGRLLQAAVSRQREFLADASAVQFTRSRDGLGNVLRKLWHDQQVLAGRMRHPSADMVASLLIHEPGSSMYLATHPRLPDRILRVCGSVQPPLPAPLIHMDTPAPRVPRTARVALGASAVASGVPADPIRQAEQARQQRITNDKDAHGRLQRMVGPTERRLIVLALMMNIGNERERKLWHRMAESLPQAARILDDVAALLPTRRVPEFERVTTSIAADPIEQRRALVESARDLLRADGRVSPRERLWWLALRHRMGVQQGKQAYMRPMTGQGHDLHQLGPQELAYVTALTSYLARFVPCEEPDEGPHTAGLAWFKGVMMRCGGGPETWVPGAPPDADALMHALAGVQELSWMIRPILLKAWVEEALNHSPHGVLTDDAADSLRLVAALIEAPLPPMLDAHYPRAA
jgi:hypothetical protein